MAEREVINIEKHAEVPFEDIPRYKYKNPLNYDEITLAKRTQEVSNIMKDYPQASRQQIEDIWDYIHIVGEEQIKKNIEEGVYNAKPTKRDICEGKMEIINMDNLILDSGNLNLENIAI